jgi:RNA 2',3'-cyclic 3'-phosphodiesterase
VRRELGLAIERLRPVAGDVAWVAAGNLHLTLKFLGQVPDERIDAIVGAATHATTGASAFEARVCGLGAFPSATRPRVVWASVSEGGAAMIDLAGRVDHALVRLGFPAESRPYSPHVTLGRVRQPGRNPELAAALGSAAEREFGRLRVTGASLMRSELSRGGARYTELAPLMLGGSVAPSV